MVPPKAWVPVARKGFLFYKMNAISRKQLLWVGLSDKQDKLPLDATTNTGKIVAAIEGGLGVVGEKVNLVDFAPLDRLGKLRYPTAAELDLAGDKFKKKLISDSSSIIVLLGNMVGRVIAQKLNLEFVTVNEFIKTAQFGNKLIITITHPSYIHIYKRQQKDKYIATVRKMIEKGF